LRLRRQHRPAVEGLAPRITPSDLGTTAAVGPTVGGERPTVLPGERQPTSDGGFAPGIGGNASASVSDATGSVGD
jgi:hypothetical protein